MERTSPSSPGQDSSSDSSSSSTKTTTDRDVMKVRRPMTAIEVKRFIARSQGNAVAVVAGAGVVQIEDDEVEDTEDEQ